MLSAESDILSLDYECLALLQAYRDGSLAAKARRTESEETGETPADLSAADSAEAVEAGDPWLSRISECEAIEGARLSELHGKLIAAGFLVFRIRNRQSGVEYRVSRPGKQFLNQLADDSSDAEAEPSQPVADLRQDQVA